MRSTWHLVITLTLSQTLWLAGCGGGGSSAPVAQEPRELVAVAKPNELLALAKQRLAAQVAQTAVNTLGVPGALGVPAPALAADASTGATAVLRSSTVVQESGVDEADLIKSNASHVYTLDDTQVTLTTGVRSLRLRSHRLLADGRTEPQASLTLGDGNGATAMLHGLLLDDAAKRLAVMAEWVTYFAPPNPCAQLANCELALPAVMLSSSEVRVHVVPAAPDGSLGEPTALALTGRLVGSRLIGSQLVLVVTQSPRIAGNTQAEQAAAVDRLTTADLLPTVRVGTAAAQPLVADTDCYLQTAGQTATPGFQVTTITVVDLASPTLARRSRCFVGDAEAMYLSPRSLYLATTRSDAVVDGATGQVRYTGTLVTDVHKFALAELAWRGSGQVDGHLGWDNAQKPYRMSEQGDHLRVLTFTGNTGWITFEDAARIAASPATLTVLREAADGRSLQRVAVLPNTQRPANLGKPGEQVHGVRFVGDRGYLVTFRRTDPLYVLDLADPADPKVAGELEVPGFSDNLFALDNGLLFGAGHDVDAAGRQRGLRFTLFDVSNPAQPTALHSEVVGDRGSYTTLGYTPHGLALRVDGDQVRLAVPAQLAESVLSSWSAGVLRFQVDTTQRSLVAKPWLPVSSAETQGLWTQRLMHSGDQLLHLVGGELLAHGW